MHNYNKQVAELHQHVKQNTESVQFCRIEKAVCNMLETKGKMEVKYCRMTYQNED